MTQNKRLSIFHLLTPFLLTSVLFVTWVFFPVLARQWDVYLDLSSARSLSEILQEQKDRERKESAEIIGQSVSKGLSRVELGGLTTTQPIESQPQNNNERTFTEAGDESQESIEQIIDPSQRIWSDWLERLDDFKLGLTLWAYRILAALTCLMFMWFVGRVARLVVWQHWMMRKTGQVAPKLLADVTMGILFGITAMFVLSRVFMLPVNGMLATSGVVGIVLGFALRSMIADFFCGVALNVERPYTIGDWIQYQDHIGRVVEINWRATRLITTHNESIIVPNGILAENLMRNYSRPDKFYRTEIEVVLEYEVPPRKAKNVLLSAAKCADMILQDPEPDVHIEKFGDDGIHYEVRYYVPDYSKQEICRDIVALTLAEHLYKAGMQIPYPKRDNFIARMPKRYVDPHKDLVTILGRVDLFQALTPEALKRIADHMQERVFIPGDIVVNQGDEDSSLFIIVEGMLEVYVKIADEMKRVGQLEAGKCFGEMSLLTGRPRTASVIAGSDVAAYEITRDDMGPILHDHPELMEKFSKIIVERESRNKHATEKIDEKAQRVERASLIRSMRSFFKKR